MIPHARPLFDASFDAAVCDVLHSGTVVMAGECDRLESGVKQRLSRRFAAAVDSGTTALMLAIRAHSTMGKIVRVGIPAFSCSAVGHAVRAAGCEAVVMDCGEDLRLDPDVAESLRDQLDAVVIVHPFGMVEPLINADWSCTVIEDIAQAAGAGYLNQEVGSFGDITIASFYATKPWGGAYGGMVLTDSEPLHQVITQMRHADTANVGIAYAGNHALSDLHAAMARVRLFGADKLQARRIALARRMDCWFESLEATPVANRAMGNGYRYLVNIKNDVDATLERLHKQGVGAARPVQEAPPASCVQARRCWQQVISLPMLADLSEEEFSRMEAAVFACID